MEDKLVLGEKSKCGYSPTIAQIGDKHIGRFRLKPELTLIKQYVE